MASVKFKHGEESLLRHFYRADLLHALLAFLLLLEKFTLTRDIAAITFCGHILAHSLDGLAGYDFGTDSCLDGDIKLLTRYQLLEFLTHAAAESHGIIHMGERRERVDTLAVEQDVKFHELAHTEIMQMIVKRRIPL